MDDRRHCALVCAVLFFVFSSICYAVTMGVGWALQAIVYHRYGGNDHVLVAIAVSTSAALCFLVYFRWVPLCKYDCSEKCSFYFILIVQVIVVVIELVGGGFFIAASTTLKDKDLFGYAISASVFCILSGCTFAIFQLCCCAYYYRQENANPEKSPLMKIIRA